METESCVVCLRLLGVEYCRRGLARLEIASVVGSGQAIEKMILINYIWLELDIISLPLSKVAGIAEMIELVPPDGARKYKSGDFILRKDLHVSHKKSIKSVKSGDYKELKMKLETKGLVKI